MRLRLLAGLVLIIGIVVACQGPPPTQIILVVTATPGTGSSPTPVDSTAQVVAQTPQPTGPSATPRPTATRDPFPTPTINQIQVAQESFEHGHMFWLQPTRQIWVLVVEREGRGTWTVYNDAFEEGEIEFDPNIEPPEGMYQPVRGFGKLWRENQEVQDALGWATTTEFGYVSPYEYHPGGSVNNGQYVAGPGYHILFSLNGEEFRFNETDGTWQLGE